MSSNKKYLDSCKLYLILDREVYSYQKLFEIAKQSILSGVDIIQLRDKKGNAREIIHFAKQVLAMTRRKIPFIINDRVDLAIISGADGVHLGQEDISIKTARAMIGKKAIVGISCQNLEAAKQAQKDGANYIGFGSVFKTLTKPYRQPMDLTLLRKVVQTIRIPVFAIGGVDLERAARLKSLGINRFAVCRALCESQSVAKTVKAFKQLEVKR